MITLSPETHQRLDTEANIWISTTRPDGRPHLTPVWFAWHQGKLYACIQTASVKARNLSQNEAVAFALENGTHPVIGEGTARAAPEPWSQAVIDIFQRKYNWDVTTDHEYDYLLEITPAKWLTW